MTATAATTTGTGVVGNYVSDDQGGVGVLVAVALSVAVALASAAVFVIDRRSALT